MAALLRELLDFVLPAACAGCNGRPGPDAPLCNRCAARLPWIPDTAPATGAAAPAGRSHEGRAGGVAAPLAAVHAAVWFEGDAADWIRRFKYPLPGIRGLDARAPAVATWLCIRAWAGARDGADLVVAVPDHGARRQARGFHPAGVLAGAVARASATPLVRGALARVRPTPSQTGLGRTARARNVAGAFRADGARVAGRRVVLVDDVVTTGATLAEAARTLRRAGARRVVCVCCARTPAPP